MDSRQGDGFAATSRFEVLRCIGSGGMGTVYEALDKERNAHVALKTLHAMTGESLLRFKKEFRDFQNLSHPNLVSVGELFSDGEDWFFSMELIDGVSFTHYVRPTTPGTPSDPDHVTVDISDRLPTDAFAGDPSNDSLTFRPATVPLFDEARLRAAAAQLAEGLIALHAANKVHCDIKPSNVLVTKDGRVVLLDFGLAADIDGREHKERVEVVGTIHYMAPEQAAGRQPGPPADWYALGIVLFEALTGTMPFTGAAMEVLMSKQHRTPPSARSLNPAVPADLDALCAELLRFNPSERPTGPQFLRRLGVHADRRPSSASAVSMGSASASSLFVGRERELHELRTSFEQSRKGAQLVALHGESGVGKSALVRRFIQFVSQLDPSVVVLRGTCYERESVPYKAVDGVIDALSLYLQRLPKAESAAVLPRKAALLAQVFPVLKRVEAIAEAPHASDEPLEPREQRGRLFDALRDLFQRLADRRPVVIAIDDMQWADADSIALLSQVLREPDSPTLLLLATVRTSGSGVEAELPLLGGMRTLTIERLSPAEGRDLALALIGQAGVPAGVKAHKVAQEAAGHPLFIHELIRHACTTGASNQTPLHLEDVLWSRISQLDPRPLQVLQLVCLADGKLAYQTAARAAGLDLGVFSQQVALLRVAHLVRTTGVRATDTVAPYHTRIRAAVLAHLLQDRSTLHRRLAIAFEMSGHPDPEALATHWREAGDRTKAAHFALAAAEKAESVLAFDRAVTFYRAALELGADDANALHVRFAKALVNAGRGAEAAAMFLVAAESARPADAMIYRQMAAEQLLRAGHFDQAFELFRTVQAAIEMPLADTPRGALAGLVWSRTRLRLRGLRFREQDVRQVSPQELAHIDIGFGIALALSTVDTIRGADLQTRQLLAALRAGEPYRVARGIALEAAFNAAGGGTRAEARTARLVRTANEVAARIDNPHALGLAAWAAGSSAYLEGRFANARELCEQAVDIYRRRCRGVAWEVASAQVFSLWASLYLGHYREVSARLPALIKDADGREDRYDATNLRTSHTNTVWLAADRPDEALAQLRHATQQWEPRTFQLPQYYVVHAYTQHALYTGDPGAAWTRVSEGWSMMKKALLMRLQILRIEMSFLRARSALALACEKSAPGQSWHLDAALRDANLLEHEQAPWAAALALLVRAGVMAERGADAAVDLFERAEQQFAAVDLMIHAAAARRRRGVLVGGSEGAALIDAADRAMRERGIASPQRMVALLAPSRM